MAVRSTRVLAALVVALSLAAPATSAAAAPVEQPIYPGGKLALAPADGGGFTTSVDVINPTDHAFEVTAPATANDCTVTVAKGATLPRATTSTIELTIDSKAGTCDAPVDANEREVVLTATAVDPAGEPLDPAADPAPTVLVTSITKAKQDDEPKATGLSWPEDPVFLRRGASGLTGEIEVANPTAAAITVLPIAVDGACLQVDAKAEPVTITAHRSGSVPVTVDEGCDDLDRGDITVVATATAGKKTDSAEVSLEAEVDWGRFSLWFGATFLLSVVLAAAAMFVGMNRHNADLRRAAQKAAAALAKAKEEDPPADADVTVPAKTRPWSPMVVKADAPKSWLTTIATVGPLLTAFVGTAGLTEGITGADHVPQSTLIVGVSAIALVLVGISTLLANAPLARATVDDELVDCPMVAQFALAAAITATSAGIALWAVWTATSRLDLPVAPLWRWSALVLFTLSLAGYLLLSVFHYVRTYAAPSVPEDPKAPTPGPELVAAAAEALAPYHLGAPSHGKPDEQDEDAWLAAARAAALRSATKLATQELLAAAEVEEAKEAEAVAAAAAAGAAAAAADEDDASDEGDASAKQQELQEKLDELRTKRRNLVAAQHNLELATSAKTVLLLAPPTPPGDRRPTGTPLI